MLSQHGVFYFLLFCSIVFSQDSHVHTTLNNDVSQSGFTFSYRVSNPEFGKRLYWIIVPESVRKMSLDQIIFGAEAVKGDNCKGFESEADELKHTVQVKCDFDCGETYRFYISLDDDRNIHEHGVAFEVPDQKSNYGTPITTTGFVLTMSEPALVATNYNEISTTKSAFNVRLSNRPSVKPTLKPSFLPTRDPTTSEPTIKPSFIPTFVPSEKPTFKPSDRPTLQPSLKPTFKPSSKPTSKPTSRPTLKPTLKPSEIPTLQPTPPTNKPSQTPIQAPLEIGDKVEVIQKGKDAPQMGCIMALPDGEGEGKWTVALEDDSSGTYLFHMPSAPKKVQTAGCLLDAMDVEPDSADFENDSKPTKEQTPSREEKKPESTSTTEAAKKEEEDTPSVKIHPLLPSSQFATDSLERVAQIRKELQAKVDAMKIDLKSKGVSIDSPGSYKSKLADIDSPGSYKSKSAESETSSASSFELHKPALPSLTSATSSFSKSEPFTLPQSVKDPPLSSSFSSKATDKFDSLEPGSDSFKKFAHPVDGEFAVNHVEELPNEEKINAAVDDSESIFSSLVLTSTMCMASVFVAAFLISKCNKKGDELDIHLLVEA